jgi:hypothetical protein
MRHVLTLLASLAALPLLAAPASATATATGFWSGVGNDSPGLTLTPAPQTWIMRGSLLGANVIGTTLAPLLSCDVNLTSYVETLASGAGVGSLQCSDSVSPLVVVSCPVQSDRIGSLMFLSGQCTAAERGNPVGAGPVVAVLSIFFPSPTSTASYSVGGTIDFAGV